MQNLHEELAPHTNDPQRSTGLSFLDVTLLSCYGKPPLYRVAIQIISNTFASKFKIIIEHGNEGILRKGDARNRNAYSHDNGG